MTAEKTVEEVENKLSDFSLFLGRHIIAVATDVVRAVENLDCVVCEHQLCYASCCL